MFWASWYQRFLSGSNAQHLFSSWAEPDWRTAGRSAWTLGPPGWRSWSTLSSRGSFTSRDKRFLKIKDNPHAAILLRPAARSRVRFTPVTWFMFLVLCHFNSGSILSKCVKDTCVINGWKYLTVTEQTFWLSDPLKADTVCSINSVIVYNMWHCLKL